LMSVPELAVGRNQAVKCDGSRVTDGARADHYQSGAVGLHQTASGRHGYNAVAERIEGVGARPAERAGTGKDVGAGEAHRPGEGNATGAVSDEHGVCGQGAVGHS